ncbi:hypothetical protein AcW1_004966 [Taiwanofungus camphoratus]|nr:hypothetical protein AcW1_004966 [Antrodia cinnamomea]
MSDFIFVKSFRLSQVMSLLASAGFDLYSSDPRNLTAQLSTFTSPLLSPAADDSTSIHLLDLAAMSTMSLQQGNSIDPDGGAVFTRSRSSTNSSSASSQSRGQPVPPHLQMSNPLDFSIGLPTANDRTEAEDMDPNTPAPPPRPSVSRAQSHSPSGCDVRVLPPDLTYIGLADDSADMWGLKIVKLVAFPELIAGLSGQTVDGASHSSSPVPVSMHDSIILPSGQMHIAAAIEGETESGSDTTTRVGLDSPKQDPELRASSESPLFDLTRSRASDDDPDDDLDNNSSDEDGYFSASPRRSTEEHPSLEEYSDTSCVSESPAKSNTGRPLLPHHDTFNTVNTIHPFNDDHDHIATRSRSRSVSVSSNLSNSRTLSPLVPFFSFTRTSEGSSLTAPVPLLAKLFPSSERHMVICSDELDIMDSRNASPTVDNVEDLDSEQDEMEAQGPLRCLQIDLRKFGLDKHGLVNRFSRTLEENGINHMYNSTYKTANLLVDRAHASHAQALLRSC